MIDLLFSFRNVAIKRMQCDFLTDSVARQPVEEFCYNEARSLQFSFLMCLVWSVKDKDSNLFGRKELQTLPLQFQQVPQLYLRHLKLQRCLQQLHRLRLFRQQPKVLRQPPKPQQRFQQLQPLQSHLSHQQKGRCQKVITNLISLIQIKTFTKVLCILWCSD